MSLKKLVDLDLLGRAVTKIKALIPNAASAAPGKVASSSSQGSSVNYARQDHTHGIDLATGDANGQVKIAGNNVSVKGLAALAYKASLGKSDVGLGNVENKSSATIRGELTKENVTTALGYTPPTTNTTYSAGDGLIQNGTKFSDHRGIEYIRGTWTADSGTWTGASTDTELYDGKQIILYMPFNGSGKATLNLTLAGGGTTGAKDVYFESDTRFTTHKGQNSQLHLIYHSALTLSDGNTYQGWWYVANRDTTDVCKLGRAYNSIKAKAAIYRYQILLTYDGEYLLPVSNGNNNTATNKTMTTEKFDPLAQIYYWTTSITVSANAKLNDWKLCAAHYNNGLIDLRYAFNTGTTLTANKAVYLVCVAQTDGSAKLHTTPISQTLPTSEDGRIYKYLGQAYDTYRITLDEDKPCYYYKNGSLRLWTNQDTNAATVNGHAVAANVPANAKFTDTTYESKAAASGGTAVSLVTTGEKYTWNNKGNGTITGIKMNGVSKGTSGVVDLGTVITSHQSLSGKQDKLVSGTNIKTINGNSLLGSGNLAVSGLPTVTSSDNDKVLKVVNGAWAVTEGGGGSSLSYTDAILHAKAPLGSSLTFTKGSISERLGPEAAHPNADGIYGDWYYSVESSNFGAWSITAALNNRYDTTTVSPAEAKQYDILLRYTIHLFENGDQYVSTTGGWYALTGTTITDSLIKIPPDQAGNFGGRGSTTVNKVSFGGRTVLKAKFVPTYNYAGASDYWFQLGLTLDKSRPNDYRQVYSLTSFTTTDVDNKNEIIASVDISDFKNSSLHVYFSLWRSGANVSEVWLEW